MTALSSPPISQIMPAKRLVATTGGEESHDSIQGGEEDAARLSKLNPACSDPQMEREAMSTQALSLLRFPREFSFLRDIDFDLDALSSYGCSREPNSSVDPSPFGVPGMKCADARALSKSVTELHEKSEGLSPSVAKLIVSRYGRSLQRFEEQKGSPPSSPVGRIPSSFPAGPSSPIRLVAGCVPILSDGRIILVSSNKKAEWILPKGGWEIDENIERCALRETFEEAGVVGILGPPLESVLYESRKARKRRLSSKEGCNAAAPVPPFPGPGSSGSPPPPRPPEAPISLSYKASPDDQIGSLRLLGQGIKVIGESSGCVDGCRTNVRPITPEHSNGMTKNAHFEQPVASRPVTPAQAQKSRHPKEGGTPQYTHVRMILFPLYVQEVKSDWPESMRLRKALPIDEAIATLSSRPEFCSPLQELKQKRLDVVRGKKNSSPGESSDSKRRDCSFNFPSILRQSSS